MLILWDIVIDHTFLSNNFHAALAIVYGPNPT